MTHEGSDRAVTVGVGIVAYNRSDFIAQNVQALLDSAEPGALDVVVTVVDNGSADETSAVAQSVSEAVRIVRNERNMPFPLTQNKALYAALEGDPDYVLLMNDDTMLLPGCLRRLVDACAANPQSLITPLQLNYRAPERIDDSAFEAVQATRALVEDAVMRRDLGVVYEIPTIVGAGIFARRETYEHIGDFDTTFRFYGIDDDYCNRAKFLGFRLLLAPEAQMYHAHGRLTDSIEANKKAWWPRWLNALQGRFMLRLKNPARSLLRNYLGLAGFVFTSSCVHLLNLWPKGAVYTCKTFAETVANYGVIKQNYDRHFDASKKLKMD